MLAAREHRAAAPAALKVLATQLTASIEEVCQCLVAVRPVEHIDFDPGEDVEEIKSTLLNRDFGLDTNNQQTLYPVNDAGEEPILPLTPRPEELPLYPGGSSPTGLWVAAPGRLVVFFRDHLGSDASGPFPKRTRSLAPGYASRLQEFVAMPKDR